MYSQNCTSVTMILEYFYHPKETPSPLAVSAPFLPPSPPLALSYQWPTVSADVDISYKQN